MPITPLCTPDLAVKPSTHHGEVHPIRCKTWACEHCSQVNRWQVIRIAKAAKPRALLTLTVSSKIYPDPDQAAHVLKNGLRNLRLWLKRHPRLENFEFLAVFEKHKSGHPHLHLLIKGKYIPWQMLKRRWKELTQSTQIDIRKIATEGQAAMYCAKYIGKDLFSFQGCKRWWRSFGYSEKSADDWQSERCNGQWGRLTANLHSFRFCMLAEGYALENLPSGGFLYVWKDKHREPPGVHPAAYGATGYNARLRYGWR